MFLLAFDSNSSPPLHYTFEFPSSHSSNGLVEQCIFPIVFPIRFSAVASILSCDQMRFFRSLCESLFRSPSLSLFLCLSLTRWVCKLPHGWRLKPKHPIGNHTDGEKFSIYFLSSLGARPIDVDENGSERRERERLPSNDCNCIMPDVMHMLCFSMPPKL